MLIAGQAEFLQVFQRLLLRLFLLPMDLSIQADIVQNVIPVQQQIALRHVGKMTAAALQRRIIHHDRPCHRLQQSGQHLEHGGLAAAARSDQ